MIVNLVPCNYIISDELLWLNRNTRNHIRAYKFFVSKIVTFSDSYLWKIIIIELK